MKNYYKAVSLPGQARTVTVGCEAIDFQHTGKSGASQTFLDLTAEIARIRAYGKCGANALRTSRLAEIIKDGTGVSVSIEFDETPCAAAAVYVPDINRNNPLLTDIERMARDNTTLRDMSRSWATNKHVSVVDIAKGKVYGAISKIVCPLYLSDGIINVSTDCNYSDSEVAAIILHEVGHIFTYFEKLLTTVRVNLAIVTALKLLIGQTDKRIRMETLTEFETFSKVELSKEDKNSLVELENADQIQTSLISMTYNEVRDITGSGYYTNRSFEYAADQFASRHGAAADLVTSLNRNANGYGYRAVKGRVAHAIMEMYKVAAAVTFGAGVGIYTYGALLGVGALVAPLPVIIGSIIGTLLACISYDPQDGLYDTPLDRLDRIMREYNVALKDRNLPQSRRQYYLDGIEEMEAARTFLRNNDTICEVIWKYVIPSGRRQNRLLELNQNIEKLTNNSLFTASAKFK